MATTHEIDLEQYCKAAQDSPGMALETIKNQIGWLEYIADHEFTEGEKQRVLSACQKFFMSIRPLTRKYID